MKKDVDKNVKYNNENTNNNINIIWNNANI